MIKLKDLLTESNSPDIFIPRRMKDREKRFEIVGYKEAVKRVDEYIKNGSKGDLSLYNLGLTKLPPNLKGITITGDFYCATNKLTSLENSPKIVKGNFYCNDNNLTTLDGPIELIGKDFSCYNNMLKAQAFTNFYKKVKGKIYGHSIQRNFPKKV